MTDPDIHIHELGIDSADDVIDSVAALLRELDGEAEDAGALDRERVLAAWRSRAATVFALAARGPDDSVIGVATVVESFAIYANGHYGVINELVVAPAWRSKGVGRALLQAIYTLGGRRKWSRIDVTAPSSGSERARKFYERDGFTFAGPKLKKYLS
jgi:GNAT superfamily N-acetyltransferase